MSRDPLGDLFGVGVHRRWSAAQPCNNLRCGDGLLSVWSLNVVVACIEDLFECCVDVGQVVGLFEIVCPVVRVIVAEACCVPSAHSQLLVGCGGFGVGA